MAVKVNARAKKMKETLATLDVSPEIKSILFNIWFEVNAAYAESIAELYTEVKQLKKKLREERKHGRKEKAK